MYIQENLIFQIEIKKTDKIKYTLLFEPLYQGRGYYTYCLAWISYWWIEADLEFRWDEIREWGSHGFADLRKIRFGLHWSLVWGDPMPGWTIDQNTVFKQSLQYILQGIPWCDNSWSKPTRSSHARRSGVKNEVQVTKEKVV